MQRRSVAAETAPRRAYDSDVPTDSENDPFGLAGTLLERKYRVDRKVAEGGFGVVYAGHHLALDVPIAIKVLKRPPGIEDDAYWDAVTQFQDEARTVAKLRHPAVVTVLDSGITEIGGASVPWMVMEWLEGETLREHLAARRGLGGRSRDEALALFRPVLDALASAHEIGVAHRDLKGSNILLLKSRTGARPRVLDFGIAKLMARDEKAGDATATHAQKRAFSMTCAAPEQLAGTRTGPWTDVYAAALLLVELLTDEPAYPKDDEACYRAAFDAKRPTPATHGKDVGSWEPILSRALAVRASERYQDAGQFLTALEEALHGRAVASGRAPRSGVPTVREGAKRAQAALEPPTESPVSATRFDRPAPKSGPTAWILGAAIVAVGAVGVYLLRARAPGHSATAPSASASAPVKACESNAACTRAAGEPAVCRPSGCVKLASEDCRALVDARAIERDDLVLVGTLFPIGDGEYARTNENAVELARRDFAQITAGLQSGGHARPIGVLACDDSANPARAAAHLADHVGVPAIIGFKGGAEAIELTTSLLVPRGVLSLVSLTTNPLVTQVPHPAGGPRLVWRTTYNGADVAAAMSAFVAGGIEPDVRKTIGAKAMRVALVRPSNAVGAAFSSAVFRTLRFNAKTALENGYDFREMTYAFEADAKSKELATLVDDVLAFAPHVVLHLGGTPAFFDGFLAPVEARWPAGTMRARFVASVLLAPDYLKIIGDSVDRRRRHFGITPLSTTSANARFVMHYNETFVPKITRTNSPNSSYDAFYLLAYATMTLAPDEPVTGASLARGFARLVPPGKSVEAGIDGILAAYSALRDGNVDFEGATGKLDFDLATGESSFDQAIVCAAIDGNGVAFDGIDSGLVYSSERKRLEGTMKCP